MTIHRFTRRVIWARTWFLVCRFVLLMLNLVVGSVVLAALLDKVLPLSMIVFQVFWVIIGLVSAGFFVHVVWRILQLHRDTAGYVAGELETRGLLRTRDELQIALDLERALCIPDAGFSQELARKQVEDMRSRLHTVDPSILAGFERIRTVLPLNLVLVVLIGVLIVLPPFVIRDELYKLLFTRRPDIHGIFVHPKTIAVAEGSSVDIRAIVMEAYTAFTPTLFLRTHGRHWTRVPLSASGPVSGSTLYRYTVRDIRRPVYYRIRFRGVVTRSYVLSPVAYPAVTSLRVEVRPPAYAGAAPAVVQSFNAMQYLVGTRLHFTIGTNVPVVEARVHEGGTPRALDRRTEREFFGVIIATRTTEVSFSLRDAEGRTERERVSYTVTVVSDRSPSVSLLAPDQDLLVSRAERVTMVYSASDDVGLRGVDLEYIVEGRGNAGRVPLVEFSTPMRSFIGEHRLDLTALPVAYGDVLAVRLRVRDNDTVNGPKTGVSETRRIELFSFERQHTLLTEELAGIVSRTAELLAREIDLRERLATGNAPAAEPAALTVEHQAMGKEFRTLAASSRDLARRMEADPYMAADVSADFERYAESLGEIAERRNPELIRKLERGDLPGAAREQDGIIEQLERLTSIGDQLQERQNMADVGQAAVDAAESARQVADALAAARGELSADDRARLERLMDDIAQRFREVVELLAGRRQDLPDAFVNRRDVSELDPSRTQGAYERLAEALSRGDVAGALHAARELLASLDAMARTLSAAGAEVASSGADGMDAALRDLEMRLDDIIANQEAVLRDTRAAEQAALADRLARQEADLERIRALVRRVRELLGDTGAFEELAAVLWYPRYAVAVQAVDRRMGESQAELETGRLLRSPDLFRESLAIWERDPVPLAATLSTGTHPGITGLTAGVREVLRELNKLLTAQLPSMPSAAGGSLAGRQRGISGRASEFAGGLRSFGQSSLMLTDDDVRRMGTAISAMDGAADSLEEGRFSEAAGRESEALDALGSIKERIGSMRSELAGQRRPGSGAPGGRRVRSAPGGRSGTLSQRVPLPSREAYIPPRELREDIIRSLSEKYPSDDEQAIRNYYRELLKLQ